MGDELQDWVQRVGNRHGFLSEGGGGGGGAAQSEDAALQQMREHNARLQQDLEERRERAEARAEELRAQGLEVEVQENPDGSIVVVGEGDRPGSPQAQMREHNERLMQQLEERRARAQARVAELREQGFDASIQENPDGSIVILGERDRLPASSQTDSDAAELEAEATRLHERASAAVDGLMTAVDHNEHVDFQNRLNSIETRRTGAAGDAQELRRVIADLRELLDDAGARSREVDRDTDEMVGEQAAGTAGPEADRDRRAADSAEQASGNADADVEALKAEGQRLFARARELVEEMDANLGTAEAREMASRLNTFNGRLNAPTLQGDPEEAQRIVTDLYATVQDFERRARELERSPDSANRGPNDQPGGDPRQNASARTDSDFAALDREAHELHGQANTIYDSLAGRLDESEHRDLRNRINAFAGEIGDPANRGNAEEMRRVNTDLRAIIDDMRARERALR